METTIYLNDASHTTGVIVETTLNNHTVGGSFNMVNTTTTSTSAAFSSSPQYTPPPHAHEPIPTLQKRNGHVSTSKQARPAISITIPSASCYMDPSEPAYLRIMQHNNAIFKDQITSVVTQLFPDLEITQESVSILNNFLQDTLVWCIMDSGHHAEKDSSNSILSCHMQSALKKLLQTTKDPTIIHEVTSTAVHIPTTTTSSDCTTPSPTSSSNSSVSSLVSSSELSPSLNPKQAPPLEYIISKRLFLETTQAIPDAPSMHTTYFLLIDHALERFNSLVHDTSKWSAPTINDDVQMMTKPVKGSVITIKAVGDIDRSPREVFASLLDFENQKKWNKVLHEYRYVEVLDKRTVIAYQHYLSKACILKSERDFCTIMHWLEKDGAYTLLAQSVEHEKCPPVRDIVRGKMNSSGYYVAPTAYGGSRVTYLAEVDLVSIPAGVSGVMQRQLNILPRLRRFITGSTSLSKQSTSSSSPGPSPPASPSLSPSPSLSAIPSGLAPTSRSASPSPSSSPATHAHSLLDPR